MCFRKFYFIADLCVWNIYLCGIWAHECRFLQRRAPGHLDLELPVVSFLIWVIKIECGPSARGASALVPTCAFVIKKHVTGLCVAGWDQLHSLRKYWAFFISSSIECERIAPEEPSLSSSFC